LRVSALRFLQCFDTVGWVTGRTSGLLKRLCQKVLFFEQVGKENGENQAGNS